MDDVNDGGFRSEPEPREEPRKGRWTPRAVLFVITLILIAFGSGFLWQYLEARSAQAERDDLRQELTYQRLATSLATAVIQADEAEYDRARESMSRFFTELQDNIATAPAAASGELHRILARRDSVITVLSRRDPVSEQLLAELFGTYRSAVTAAGLGTVPPASMRAPAPVDTAGAAGPPPPAAG